MERTVSIQFRLTPVEKAKLQQKANAVHLSVSSYVRLKVLADDE